MKKKRIALIEAGKSEADSFDSLFIIAGLGPLSIASFLEQNGYEVRFFPMFANPELDEAYIRSCDYLLFSAMTHTAKLAYQLAARFREQTEKPPITIFGGVHAGVLVKDAACNFDYVVINEGEATVLELLRYLDSKNGGDPSCVKGIAYKTADGKVVRTPPRPFMREINFALKPSLIQNYPSVLADFRRHGRLRYPTALVNFSRGCPFSCSFCLGMRQLGQLYRTRDPESVIRILNEYHQATGATHAIFHDNEFTIDLRKTKELLRMIIRERPKIRTFTLFARIDCTRDEELWRLFEEAGVTLVIFGAESLHQKTLDSFSKRIMVDTIHTAMERVSRFTVKIVASFIVADVEDPLKELSLIREFHQQYAHTLRRIIVAPLMEYPFQKELWGESQLISDEKFIHHDWNYYSGDFLYFYPDAVPPSVLQRALLETIRDNNRVPKSRLWDPYHHLSQALVRHTYRPTEKKIERYISFLEEMEKGKYDRMGKLIPDRLAGDFKPSEIAF